MSLGIHFLGGKPRSCHHISHLPKPCHTHTHAHHAVHHSCWRVRDVPHVCPVLRVHGRDRCLGFRKYVCRHAGVLPPRCVLCCGAPASAAPAALVAPLHSAAFVVHALLGLTGRVRAALRDLCAGALRASLHVAPASPLACLCGVLPCRLICGTLLSRLGRRVRYGEERRGHQLHGRVQA